MNIRSLTRLMPDEMYLKMMFYKHFGYFPNLNEPKTFNEKLQWLKLHDRQERYTLMVDKYEAKQYVANIIGEEYIIPTLGVWTDAREIDWNSLPDRFVLKCNNDSGGVVICRNKSELDIPKTTQFLNRRLRNNGYWYGREWPYKNIKPRIIAEKYIEDSSTEELWDYKFFCFNGIAKCYKVDFDRFINHKANYFSSEGELLKIGETVCPPDFEKEIPTPVNFDKMKEFAMKLSDTHPFLRTDFYDVDGKIYFGELTFYPASGFGKFIYDGNDELLGSWIKLPDSIGGGYSLIYNDVLYVLDKSANTGVSKACTNPNVTDSASHGLADYKIHSFNGMPKVILVCRDRFSKSGLTEDFFDENWTHLDIKREQHPNSTEVIDRPAELDKMLELSRKLSKDIPFLRSDFYIVGGKVYFGELTFFPASGFAGFKPESYDKMLGDWLILPVDGGEH